MSTLCIDIGNTRCKLALYEGSALQARQLTAAGELAVAVGRLADRYAIGACVYAAVGPGRESLSPVLERIGCPTLELNAGTPGLPVTVDYDAPHTLGSDRLAAALGAYALLPGRDVLIADFGTCATYDLLTADGHFLGGNIAPGLKMRLTAMHRGTAALPAVGRAPSGRDSRNRPRLLGTDTAAAMQHGATWGLAFETEGYAARLGETYPSLRLLLTGGQASVIHELLPAPLRAKALLRTDLVMLGLLKAAQAAGLSGQPPQPGTTTRKQTL